MKDNEIGALKEALDGKYVEPGPGGDPIRNPGVLPTGKNIHALDPQSIPTAAAIKNARLVVDRLLERQAMDNNGAYPESIAVVLWGTDNIKTYGESLAQVMMMVGVKPVPDALGRVNKLEVIPLEELGRPRIDVVVNCSGVFRDLFVNQMSLMDRAIKLAAEQDEPLEMNDLLDMLGSQADPPEPLPGPASVDDDDEPDMPDGAFVYKCVADDPIHTQRDIAATGVEHALAVTPPRRVH